MVNFDLGISPAHSSPGPTHRDHTQLYNLAIYLLSHPYMTKGVAMSLFVCVVVVYWVWLIRSTLKRLDTSTGQTGQTSQTGVTGGEDRKGYLTSSSLTGHTQVS